MEEDRQPSDDELLRVRAAADVLVAESGSSAARGTLAALDWVEGRRSDGPSSGEHRRPLDVVIVRGGVALDAWNVEAMAAADHAEGAKADPRHDRNFHLGVRALLGWWRYPDSRQPLIAVPGLDVEVLTPQAQRQPTRRLVPSTGPSRATRRW